MMIKPNNLYLGCCLELLPMVESNSIDAIICDLPYGITSNKRDIELPLDSLWSEYKRLLKPNGSAVLFGQDKFTAKLVMSNLSWHKYNLVWKKGERTTGFLNAKKMPLKNHEDIVVFYNKQPTYNPQYTIGKPIHGRGKAKGQDDGTNNVYGKYKPGSEITNKKYPKSILNFDKPHPAIHPTQKPVALLEYLIKTYTNEGDIVLDHCMGIGSTCIAAKNTNRKYIGIEKNIEYFNKAESLLNNKHWLEG